MQRLAGEMSSSPPGCLARSSPDIVQLNVGGTRFTTSRQTLTQLQDTFFSGEQTIS